MIVLARVIAVGLSRREVPAIVVALRRRHSGDALRSLARARRRAVADLTLVIEPPAVHVVVVARARACVARRDAREPRVCERAVRQALHTHGLVHPPVRRRVIAELAVVVVADRPHAAVLERRDEMTVL